MRKDFGSKIKLLLMGRSGVGKSAIVASYQDGHFNPIHEPSTGCHLVNLPVTYKETTYQLLVMDSLADSDLTLSCRLKSIQNTEILAIVFDLTDEETFIDIKDKLRIIKDNFYSHNRIILVGNKADLEAKVTGQEIEELIKSTEDYQLDYFEASAKTGINISNVFLKALELGYYTSKARWDRIKVILFTYKFSLPTEHTQVSWANLCEALPALMKKKQQANYSLSLMPPEIIKRILHYI